MENNIIFYPMSELPAKDESDASFSKTVIIYNNKLNFVDLGYFDFEEGQWSHFGENSFLLKCWCYIPTPLVIEDEKWEIIAPKGYQKQFF
ncbi:hypothetical protein D3C87_289070 [compost metagenome]